ncbi:hypothetical protein BC936DRAFT_141799 [Jimgerdemannia flammicorona]|uniref:Uncharacterized protein n=1 Tax=Jimgerdemannia flammicorona TaxID=994334 RepID=A0A433A1L0_9FUNG|nr:hypothetical protein BC936DRAFT_141799 [Jimgerdemannia flammicorona]
MDEHRVDKLQVVGMLHFGLNAQLVRMWRAGSSVLIFKKEELWTLPEEFSPTGFGDLLKFLGVVWQMRGIMWSDAKIIGDINNHDNDESHSGRIKAKFAR